MKLDAHVIVDPSNDPLLTRSAGYPLSACAQDLRAVRDEWRNLTPLFLLRSYVDEAGKEVMAEFCEPLANACLENGAPVKGARVEVWHRKVAIIAQAPEAAAKSDYELAGVFLVPHAAEPEKMLSVAYDLSQALEEPFNWNPVHARRPTAAGDVLVVQLADELDSAYSVAHAGFTPVSFV